MKIPNILSSPGRKRAILLTALALLLVVAAFIGFGAFGGDDDAALASEQAGEHAEGEAGHAEGGEQGGEGHAGEVQLTAEQAEQLGIQVRAAEGGSASATLRRPATVGFNLDRVAKVGPRVPSKVVRVLKDLGDHVRRGETLAVLSSVELGRAKSQYITAQARLATQKAEYEREGNLREEQISSEAEFLEAKAQYEEARAEFVAAREALRLYGLSAGEVENIGSGEQPLSYFRLESPITGVVQERALSPGQSVSPEETPIHVANLSDLWVMIDAYERDVPLLDEGREVLLSARSLPDQTFRGVIDWISYELDEETRTIRARAIVDNPEHELRPGMFGTARVNTAQEIKRAIIPVDAVQQIGDETVVFAPADEAGSYRPVPVELGEEGDGVVEVLSGIAPGDEVVVAGAFGLKSALTAGSRSAAHGH